MLALALAALALTGTAVVMMVVVIVVMVMIMEVVFVYKTIPPLWFFSIIPIRAPSVKTFLFFQISPGGACESCRNRV